MPIYGKSDKHLKTELYVLPPSLNRLCRDRGYLPSVRKADFHHPLLIPSWITYPLNRAVFKSFLVAFTEKYACLGTIDD